MKDGIRRGLSLILFATLLFLPMGFFKVNRVLNGSVFSLWNLGQSWILVLFALLSTIKIEFKWLSFLRTGFLIILPSLLIYLSQSYVITEIYDPNVARISLGPSIYLALIGAWVLLSTEKQGALKISMSLLVLLVLFGFGMFPMLGFYKEYINRQATFFLELQRHISLAVSSLLFAMVPGIYLGYQSTRHPRLREWIMGFVNAFQVAPTLSMLALLMIPLASLGQNFPFLRSIGVKGVGFLPAFIVLSLYALLPITGNTYTAFKQLDPAVMDSAKALGLSSKQIFRKVSFPLALPFIITGIRIAFIQNIGNTILAGLVGGGGMGSLIFLGLAQSATDLILLGSLPVVLMALGFEVILEYTEVRLKRKMGVLYDQA
jgi:osmoprotectant transport system permease protein